MNRRFSGSGVKTSDVRKEQVSLITLMIAPFPQNKNRSEASDSLYFLFEK